MKHTIEHGLGDIQKAKGVLEKAAQTYQERFSEYHPSLTWQDDRHAKIEFKVMGKSLTVNTTVSDQNLVVEGKLPLVFKPFQGKIISVIEREVTKWTKAEQA